MQCHAVYLCNQQEKYRTSIAVLYACNFTANGSQTPNSFISTILPDSPSMPNVLLSAEVVACLARKAVSVRITSPPQFCTNVLGITSSALLNALKGHCFTPV